MTVTLTRIAEADRTGRSDASSSVSSTTSTLSPTVPSPPHVRPLVPDASGWLTATVRPAGSFGRADAGRLRALLDALSACASMVVLDLQAARLCSPRAAEVIDDAADELERRGGCLLCVNADDASLAHLAAAGHHTVLVPRPTP